MVVHNEARSYTRDRSQDFQSTYGTTVTEVFTWMKIYTNIYYYSTYNIFYIIEYINIFT